MKRLLVTTALEESWEDTQPMLFLGEWCRLYSRRHRLSGLDAIVLPYHWNDSLKLQRDRQYLANLHEVLLVELGNELNERHRSDHSIFILKYKRS